MTRWGYLALLHRKKNGAAFFLGVGAFGISAFSDIFSEFAHIVSEILIIKKVEAFKIKQRKSGRVGNISAVT